VNQLRMCSSCNQPDIKKDQTLKAFSITRMLGYLLIPFIKIYQYIISPVMGPKCRFVPTCSQYGEQALKKYGLFKGGWLLIKRLSKCRPGGGSGWDPSTLRRRHSLKLNNNYSYSGATVSACSLVIISLISLML
jgi:putative membrane protein insertion efficiency factor